MLLYEIENSCLDGESGTQLFVSLVIQNKVLSENVLQIAAVWWFGRKFESNVASPLLAVCAGLISERLRGNRITKLKTHTRLY